jgi:dephospho-CoA kinase
MLMVGLTGGIASGKSLVTRVLRDLGAHIIDADKIVHNLLSSSEDACNEVISHFGSSVRLSDGSIDRRKLGDIIFSHPEERAWLNNCIHPRVFQIYKQKVRSLSERNPDSIVVLDAALLIETGYHKQMDKLIVVYANQKDQVKRLMERDRFTLEQAMARISSQLPLDEKRKYADYVIDNTGTRESSERQAREVFERLKQKAGRQE